MIKCQFFSPYVFYLKNVLYNIVNGWLAHTANQLVYTWRKFTVRLLCVISYLDREHMQLAVIVRVTQGTREISYNVILACQIVRLSYGFLSPTMSQRSLTMYNTDRLSREKAGKWTFFCFFTLIYTCLPILKNGIFHKNKYG